MQGPSLGLKPALQPCKLMQKSWGSEEQGPVKDMFPLYVSWCPVHVHSAVTVL